MVQKSNVGNLKKGSSKKIGRAKDILKVLKRCLTGTESASASVPQLPAQPSAKDVLTGIFRCTICLSTSQLPVASCSKCFGVIGCIPFIEHWIGVTPTLSKCPLCRTSRHYNVIPMVREIAAILGHYMPDSNESNDVASDDTIPYGVNDNDDDDDDDQLPQML